MLVSTMRSVAAAVETADPSFSARLCCNSIALLGSWGAAFRLPAATTPAARAGSLRNAVECRRFPLEPQGVDAWLMSERRHIPAKRQHARRRVRGKAPSARRQGAGRNA